jgi:hypothetical protein
VTTKIINPGTDQYRATCTECGCRFTYERDDVHRVYRPIEHMAVDCPHCWHGCTHFGASGTVWLHTDRRGNWCVGRA